VQPPGENAPEDAQIHVIAPETFASPVIQGQNIQ